MPLRNVIVGTLLLASLDVPRAVAQTCDSAPLLIRNANVWTRDGIVANRDVVFRAGRVAVIEPTSSQRYDRVRTIDGTDHTLLPGLIDAHLHLSIPGGLPALDKPRTDAEDIAGRQLLRSGVTSGRVHLATLDEAARLKTRSANACEPMPRLQVGGLASAAHSTETSVTSRGQRPSTTRARTSGVFVMRVSTGWPFTMPRDSRRAFWKQSLVRRARQGSG